MTPATKPIAPAMLGTVLRENLQRVFSVLETPQPVTVRGQSECDAYGFEPTQRVLSIGGDRFMPLTITARRGEGSTMLCNERQIGWSATRVLMLPLRDFDMTMWRLSSAWPRHFFGFTLIKIEAPRDHSSVANLLRVQFGIADRPGIWLEHPWTGPVRFELPA